jgi:hypothetical protein
MYTGRPETTVTATSSDTKQGLADLGATITLTGASGVVRRAKYALITVETNAIRIGTNNATTALGHLVNPGKDIILENADEIEQAEIISAVAGAHGTLQITTEF